MIRCLIVDDSPTFRGVMRRILADLPDIEVTGEADDGDEAVAKVHELRPDVVTMDVHMPRCNGLKAIAEIMRTHPTPIVVISSSAGADNPSLSFQALKVGAVEVLGKPNGLDPAQVDRQHEAIRRAVRAVAGLRLGPRGGASTRLRLRLNVLHVPRCIGIVASTGGPPALQRVLGTLPAHYPVPILVVQHIAPGFAPNLVRWLADQCSIEIRLAQAGDRLKPGTALIAPDDYHLMISRGQVRLDSGPPVKNLRPSGTVLLTSLARELGDAAAGLVLTGMGDDGTEGLQLMRERGAFTAAQGKVSSVVFGMPEVALRTGAAQFALELDDIAPALLRLAGMDRTGSR